MHVDDVGTAFAALRLALTGPFKDILPQDAFAILAMSELRDANSTCPFWMFADHVCAGGMRASRP